MPGNGGILPDQNSFSVPVEMPVWAISTTMSSGPGASSATDPSSIAPGLLRITATVSMALSPLPGEGDSGASAADCQLKLTLFIVNKNGRIRNYPGFRAVTTPVTKGRSVRRWRRRSKPAAVRSSAIASGERTCPVRIAMV